MTTSSATTDVSFHSPVPTSNCERLIGNEPSKVCVAPWLRDGDRHRDCLRFALDGQLAGDLVLIAAGRRDRAGDERRGRIGRAIEPFLAAAPACCSRRRRGRSCRCRCETLALPAAGLAGSKLSLRGELLELAVHRHVHLLRRRDDGAFAESTCACASDCADRATWRQRRPESSDKDLISCVASLLKQQAQSIAQPLGM